MPKRQYSDRYIYFGFNELRNRGESVPQCVVCMTTLSNASIKTSLLQRHLQTNHPDKKDRHLNYFKPLGEKAKEQRLGKTEKQYQQSVGIVTASYKIALLVAKNKKPHTIAEELTMPAPKVLVQHVIGDKAVSKLNRFSVSNNTIQRRITEGVKAVSPSVTSVYCSVHRFVMAAKLLPSGVKTSLNPVVEMVNYIKASVLNSCLFKVICEDIGSEYMSLLFHLEVRWLSRGNTTTRLFCAEKGDDSVFPNKRSQILEDS